MQVTRTTSSLPSWLSISSTTGVLSGTPANDDTGLIDITVTATDSDSSAVSDAFNLTINNINDLPQGTNDSIVMKDSDTYVLKASDFGFNDAEDGTILTAVRFDSLPATGNLRYLGADMFTGIYISKAELDEEWITYTPVQNTNADSYASLAFTVKDSLGAEATLFNSIVFRVGATYTIQADTTLIQGGGLNVNTVVFTQNFADYSFSQNGLITEATNSITGQVVNITGVEFFQFNDILATPTILDNYSEFQVNTYTSSGQHSPSITALNDGGFVVTWYSYGQDAGDGEWDSGIYAQRYDAGGNTQGSEFRVSTYASNNEYAENEQENPDITALADGGFVVAWSSENQDGNSSGIYAQRYDASGNTQGSEFQVNTYTSNGQKSPDITALADGGFVVTWQSYYQDGSSLGIYAQRYDASGNTQGSEFQVNTYTSNHQYNPSTTALADGGFVVTWMSYNQDGSDDGIYAQRYDASGNTQGSEFQVNTYTSSGQHSPSITALADGGFVVTWESYYQDGSNSSIYAQRYDASGNTLGSEFQVNTYTSSGQHSPSITALADGGFVVTWQSYNQDGDSSGIYAQRYDEDGNSVGAEFQVNTYTSNDQYNPSTTALADGGFVVTWESYYQDGSGFGIYAQRYDVTGNTNTITFDVVGEEVTLPSALIQTDSTNYLDNLSLNYFKDGVDTGIATLVEGGDITFPATSLDFDAVKLSDTAAYTDGIAADDAVDVLRDIVHLDSLTVDSAAWHSADVNNDGVIAADDAVAILRHIVQLDTIDTFDLIDNTTGNRITSLDTNAIDIGHWSIVANGDVDQSGGFGDAYVVQMDIV